MTPEERKLVTDLFDRLQTLENAPRDDVAVDLINQGLDRAPNSPYSLVQTVLVQDEALKRADARIRELEAQLGIGPSQNQEAGSFLDGMRETLRGKREPQGSVPSVRANRADIAGAGTQAAGPGGENKWGPAYSPAGGAPMQGQQPYAQPQQQSGGGSFLGTAAATVAGVVGGALLMKSFSGMFGGQQPGQSHSAFDQQSGAAPWGSDVRNSDLARDAGLNDIGGGGGRRAAYDDGGSDRVGMFDVAQSGGDYGGGDNGGDGGGGDA